MINLKKNLLALLVGLAIAFLLAEIAIRLFPHKFRGYIFENSTIAYKEDKEIGYRGVPDQKGACNYGCLRIYPVHSNSLGFRGDEWGPESGFKIGVLGDSFMEAQQVSEGDYASFILKKLLDKEILNAGLAGYNTVTELLVYKKFLRPLRPNISILFFTLGSDIQDNSCELVKSLIGPIVRPCGYIAGNGVKVETHFIYPASSQKRADSGIKKFVKQHCLSCLLAYRFSYDKFIYKVMLRESNLGGSLARWYYCAPPKTKDWQEAWEITEKTLAQLKKEVEADGGKLLVVSVSEHLRNSRDWKKEIKKETGVAKIPPDFDPFYPLKKLQEITTRQGIAFLALEPYFLAYRDKFGLAYPYFSYRCDGHWNPLGHFLAANIVARYLIEYNLVPLAREKREGLLNKIERNLHLSPAEILGQEAYQEIYHWGVYLGSANISKILQDN